MSVDFASVKVVIKESYYYYYLAPPLGVTPFEFCQDLRHQKTRVHGYRVAFACCYVWPFQ